MVLQLKTYTRNMVLRIVFFVTMLIEHINLIGHDFFLRNWGSCTNPVNRRLVAMWHGLTFCQLEQGKSRSYYNFRLSLSLTKILYSINYHNLMLEYTHTDILLYWAFKLLVAGSILVIQMVWIYIFMLILHTWNGRTEVKWSNKKLKL